MLKKPILARCADRSILAKQHPTAGGPDDWLSDELLSKRGLRGVYFDYFVNWNTTKMSQELWIKRILNNEHSPWPDYQEDRIQNLIDDCDGIEFRKCLAKFATKYSFKLRFQIFKDIPKWDDKSFIISADINQIGNIELLSRVSLEELMRNIKTLSGGPVSVGSKGLYYGTSYLECYLSHTDAAWPGDVDLIITDTNSKALAILEYKKHTQSGTIHGQKLSNYYPNPDRRKYDRIAILRKHLGENIPIIVLYYSTNMNIKLIKMELIGGQIGSLESIKSQVSSLPSNKNDLIASENLLNAIMGIVNQ